MKAGPKTLLGSFKISDYRWVLDKVKGRGILQQELKRLTR